MAIPLYQRSYDCVAEFEAAAIQRHAEAEQLGKRSHHLGAIYLYGYSVEMRVKALYFRNAGFGQAAPISNKDRSDGADMYQVLGLLVKPGQHDIAGWATLAVAARATCTKPYLAPPGTRIVDHATDLYVMWRESLRYRSTRPLGAEFRLVRRIADWFSLHYARML